MEVVTLMSLRIHSDSHRKLQSPSRERLYPLPSFTISALREDLFTRSEIYLGFTATFRRSVNDAELLQFLTMWLRIWTRRLFEKKSHMSHKASKSASESSNSLVMSCLVAGFHEASESGRSSRTSSSFWSVSLRPIANSKRKGISGYLEFLSLNYRTLSIRQSCARP